MIEVIFDLLSIAATVIYRDANCRMVFNFVVFFHSDSNDSKFTPDIIDLTTKESVYVIS